ncbi:MAG: NHL repeat-containing protein, partial [Planctomycetota bacterium]
MLVKFNAEGEQLWAVQTDSMKNGNRPSLAVDSEDYVYLVSVTGENPRSNVGGMVSLDKYGADGNRLWRRPVGVSDVGYIDVGADAVGNAYVVMSGWGLGKYDAGGNQLWVRPLDKQSKKYQSSVAVGPKGDIFVGYTVGTDNASEAKLAKYNPDGQRLWVQTNVTDTFNRATAVSADDSGGAILVGWESQQLPPLELSRRYSDRDAFIARYDPAGNLLWQKVLRSNKEDSLASVSIDATGHIYVTGQTFGQLLGINQGYVSAFLAKYDVSGALHWIKPVAQSQRVNFDIPTDLVLNPSNNALIAYTSFDSHSRKTLKLTKLTARGPDTVNPLFVDALKLIEAPAEPSSPDKKIASPSVAVTGQAASGAGPTGIQTDLPALKAAMAERAPVRLGVVPLRQLGPNQAGFDAELTKQIHTMFNRPDLKPCFLVKVGIGALSSAYHAVSEDEFMKIAANHGVDVLALVKKFVFIDREFEVDAVCEMELIDVGAGQSLGYFVTNLTALGPTANAKPEATRGVGLKAMEEAVDLIASYWLDEPNPVFGAAPTRFWFDYPYEPSPGKRFWSARGDIWTERYEGGQISGFQAVGRMAINRMWGTQAVKISGDPEKTRTSNDGNFQVFISDPGNRS